MEKNQFWKVLVDINQEEQIMYSTQYMKMCIHISCVKICSQEKGLSLCSGESKGEAK